MDSASPAHLLHLICKYLIFLHLICYGGGGGGVRCVNGGDGSGRWQLLQRSIGITAMHMQLLNNDRVVIYDRTDFGASQLPLPEHKCRNDPHEMALKRDCTAHSAEYDASTNSFRPLTVQTDVWCSSGAMSPDGNLVQAGGFNDGSRKVRIFSPCPNSSCCDWHEMGGGLAVSRWYATSQVLPDGRQIVVGGRRQFSYEFYPKPPSSPNVYSLRFLVETYDEKLENNLYPFVFLNVDGNLFIFANNRAILFNYRKGAVVRTYPALPGSDPRNYPSTGSAVLLPLKINIGRLPLQPEVMVCGGAPRGAFEKAQKGKFMGALNTCGRINITAASPRWAMETMPLARVMGDMTLLPNGDVLIINGAAAGTAGWEYGRAPVLKPVIYKPGFVSPGSGFHVQNPSSIPRMYHSSAVLLRDGRVLVGGSNPHVGYTFTGTLFPTELSLEAFSPPYLDPGLSGLRPTVQLPSSHAKLHYRQLLRVRFSVSVVPVSVVSVTMVSPSFTTHSFSMNQRLLVIGEGVPATRGGRNSSLFEVRVTAPDSPHLAPSGYYILFVVNQGVPSDGVWIHLQ